MYRTTALIIGLTLLAGSASADQYTVTLYGKSPAQVRTEINDAAYKACKAAYYEEIYADYELDSCVADSVEAAQAQARTVLAANGTRRSR